MANTSVKFNSRKKTILNTLGSKIAFYIFLFLLFIAVFSNYIANDQPLYAVYKNKIFYPAFSTSWVGKNIFNTNQRDTIFENGKIEIIQFDVTDWRKLKLSSVVWPLVPFSPNRPDYYNKDFVSPGDEQYIPSHNGGITKASGRFRHILGSDELGRDVLSGLIHGTKISLLVAFCSMLIAGVIGLIIGLVTGYYGDKGIRLNWISLFLFFPIVMYAYFIAFITWSTSISEAFETGTGNGILQFLISFLFFILMPLIIIFLLNKIRFSIFKYTFAFPIDSFLSRFTEIFNAIPKLLLIISIAAITEQRTVWLVIVIIGFTSWTEIARLCRAEIMRIKTLGYIEAAKSLGYNDIRLLVKHALPNAMRPLIVAFTFGMASSILIESGLSFLGVGVSEEVVTWGSMLNLGRQEMEAWWMIVYPGLCIFISIICLNFIAEGITNSNKAQ